MLGRELGYNAIWGGAIDVNTGQTQEQELGLGRELGLGQKLGLGLGLGPRSQKLISEPRASVGGSGQCLGVSGVTPPLMEPPQGPGHGRGPLGEGEGSCPLHDRF